MTVNKNKMVFGIYRKKKTNISSTTRGRFRAGPVGGRADGTILDWSPLHREWIQRFDVPYRKDPPPTFYQAYGYRLVPAILILAMGTLLMTGRRGRQEVS